MALTNTQHQTILREYEQAQTYNRQLLEERREQVYECIPQFRELEVSAGALAVARGKLLLEGKEEALEGLHASLTELSAKKKALLKAAGFSEDYLEPLYRCPLCKDTGYLKRPEGGQEKCSCFKRREVALLYRQSNIQEMLKQENFSTLSYEYYQGEDLNRFRKCVEICRNFTDSFLSPQKVAETQKQDYRNLFFYGTVGTGKSFLSGCIANELLQAGHSVIYFSASDLFDTLARYSFDAKAKENLSSLYQDIYDCELLIIDDLGTEITNSFVASQLFSLLNERHLRQKSTIISTNLSLEELRDRYSDRVFSRITGNYTLCKLTGPDIRMYKKRHL